MNTGWLLFFDILHLHINFFSLRIAICMMFAFASFFMVAYSITLWFSLLGEIFVSNMLLCLDYV